jgi:hypothetical protein
MENTLFLRSSRMQINACDLCGKPLDHYYNTHQETLPIKCGGHAGESSFEFCFTLQLNDASKTEAELCLPCFECLTRKAIPTILARIKLLKGKKK